MHFLWILDTPLAYVKKNRKKEGGERGKSGRASEGGKQDYTGEIGQNKLK